MAERPTGRDEIWSDGAISTDATHPATTICSFFLPSPPPRSRPRAAPGRLTARSVVPSKAHALPRPLVPPTAPSHGRVCSSDGKHSACINGRRIVHAACVLARARQCTRARTTHLVTHWPETHFTASHRHRAQYPTRHAATRPTVILRCRTQHTIQLWVSGVGLRCRVARARSASSVACNFFFTLPRVGRPRPLSSLTHAHVLRTAHMPGRVGRSVLRHGALDTE